MSWPLARSYCQSQRAELASITNSATNLFLTTLTHKTSWIGGYRTGSAWRWTDGSRWNYTNWSINNPSNDTRWPRGGQQDKTSFNWWGVGSWDDDWESVAHPFICNGKRKKNLKLGL